MVTKIKDELVIFPLKEGVGIGKIPKRKVYRDIDKNSAYLMKKYNIAVNKVLLEEMTTLDNQTDEIWD